jgi:hypothetical protein
MSDRRLMDLQRRRRIECRLTPDRALQTLEDATAFLSDRGLLTRMADTALPSLFGACHEEPAQAGGQGFALWPKTKWIWSFQLVQQPGILLAKLHRGKSLFLSAEAARLIDPLVRKSIAAATGDEATLLQHLGDHGESMSEDIEVELGWDRRRLKRARTSLERVGALVSNGLVFVDEATWHFAPMRRWDAVTKASKADGDPYEAILLAGMRAAVVAPEADLRGWFSWPFPAGTVDALVRSGRLTRPAPGWIALAD